MERNKYTFSLIKVKEAHLKFFTKVLMLAEEWKDEEYPEGNAKTFMKNADDGCYEIIIEVEEDE